MGRAVAGPISRRTRFTQEQVEAFLGFLLLAYALYRIGRTLLHAARSA